MVEIKITEDKKRDLLQIVIKDNGSGMDQEMIKKARDPFVTTRTTRRVGLGLSMLEQAAQETGGDLSIVSEAGQGTEIKATFHASHIDRKPMGDMGSSIISLIVGNPDVDFVYESDLDGEKTSLDTRMIKEELDGVTAINDPAVLRLIRDLFQSGG